jgi:hypothetical protein
MTPEPDNTPGNIDGREHVARLSSDWHKQHDERKKTIKAELMKQHPNADAAERLLLGLVSHDVALAETLGDTEVQLVHRSLALVDNLAVGLALAKTLKQVSLVREAATRRVQDLLQTARVLSGQRKLAEKPALRRVA